MAQDTLFSDSHPGREYEPPQFESAKHYRERHLLPERDWERIDIWIPKDVDPDDRLPCIVNLYGGGYGNKSKFHEHFEPLIERGYVVVQPDYVLGSKHSRPLCSWDAANGIRYIRRNAAKYNVDPERIGVVGWSAGGWITQHLLFDGPAIMQRVSSYDREGNEEYENFIPWQDPHPLYPETSIRVQAAVSDWGVGKLTDKNSGELKPFVTPDDPPLMSCWQESDSPPNTISRLRDIGVPARGVWEMDTKSTHVPSLTTACVDEEGNPSTWEEEIYKFLDDYVKNVTEATPPEIFPYGHPVNAPVEVKLLTVHPDGTIHYTLDGSEPTENSAVYTAPITVIPGQTLKTFATKPGLSNSRIATAEYPATLPASAGPVRITEFPHHAFARVGDPFSMSFSTEGNDNPVWTVLGSIGDLYSVFQGVDKKRYVPWIEIDQDGTLSGTPRISETYTMYVQASWYTGSLNDPDVWTSDVRPLIITVVDSTDSIPSTRTITQQVRHETGPAVSRSRILTFGKAPEKQARPKPVFDLRGRKEFDKKAHPEASGVFIVPNNRNE